MRKPLNFNLTKTESLLAAQSDVFDELQTALADSQPWETSGQPVDEALNVSFFLPRDAQVLLPYTAADRNYLFRQSDDDTYLMTRFETLLLPGRWLRRRLLKRADLGFNPGRLIAVGAPRLDVLRRLAAAHAKAPTSARKRVLWVPSSPIVARPKKGGPKVEPTSSQPVLDSTRDLLAGFCDLVEFPDLHDEGFDRSVLVPALLDADVVITDCDPIFYDAWALDTPVIFTTWLVGAAVAERFPGSAETWVYQREIGHHAASVEDLCERLANVTDIGPGVAAFMDDYFENYRGDVSAPRIAAALERLRDTDSVEREKRLDEKLRAILKLVPAKAPVQAALIKPRVSIQVAQLTLLKGDFDLFDETSRLMRDANAAASIQTELAALKIESLFMRNRLELIEARKTDTSLAQQHLRLRIALARGDLEAALEQARVVLAAGGRSPATYRLLAEVLVRLDRGDVARSLLLKLCKAVPSVDLLMSAVETVQTERDARDFAATLLPLQSALGKVLGTFDLGLARLRAVVRGGDFAQALPMAAGLARRIAKGEKGTAAPTQLTGWHLGEDLPSWHSPFEVLPTNATQRDPRLLDDAMEIVLGHVARLNLPVFPAGGTLRALLGLGESQHLPAVPELGALGAEAAAAAVAALERTGFVSLISVDGGAARHGYHLRAANGVRLVLRVHQPQEDGTLMVRVAGVVTRLAGFALAHRRIGNHDVPVPADPDSYLAGAIEDDATTWNSLGVLIGRDRSVASLDELAVALHLELIAAYRANTPERITGIVTLLRDIGHPELWFIASDMGGKYLGPGAGHMADLIRKAHYLLHIGDGMDGAFYVDLWYPYCKAGDPNCILAVRTQALFDHLRANRPDLDVILLKTQMDAEWLISNAPNLKGVMFVSNVGNNLHIYRFNHLTHIWLGHGDSDKVASCHKAFRAYDEVWAAGRAQIDRFVNAGFDHSSVRFRVVGRPTLRERLPQIEAAELSGFLYLPTWEGNLSEQSYSSVDFCEQFLPQVAALTGIEGVIKFHPWVGRRLPQLNALESRLGDLGNPANKDLRVIPRAELAADLMTTARFMVADVSSVVSDYLVTGRPIFLFKPLKANLRMATSAMPLESYCYVFHTADHLADLVRQVIVEGDDYLGASREEARQYFVDITRTVNGQFETEMANLLAEHPSNPHPWHIEGVPNSVSAPRKAPLIIGHRGDKSHYCENSLSGFVGAAQIEGLDGIELDVHLSADGVPVVIHDATLDRTTTGSGFVGALTAAQLADLRLRWRAPGASAETVLDEGVPTLDQVLELLSIGWHRLYVEIKGDATGTAYPGLEAKVLSALRKHKMLDRTTLTSFAPNVLNRLRALDSAIPLLASVNYRSVEMLGGLPEALRQFAFVRHCGLTLETKLIRAIEAQGGHQLDLSRVGEWVVNTEDGIDHAIKMRRREIFTDDPVLALERRRKKSRARNKRQDRAPRQR